MAIILLFAAAAFLLGYAQQDFGLMMKVFAAGVVLAGVVAVPDWPAYNRHPLHWLPAKASKMKRPPNRRRYKATFSNLWGAFSVLAPAL
jgi:signal peptidase complex subunit 1